MQRQKLDLPIQAINPNRAIKGFGFANPNRAGNQRVRICQSEPSGQVASRTERAKQMVRICQSEPSGQAEPSGQSKWFGFANPNRAGRRQAEPSGQAASRTERAKQMVRICQSEPSGQAEPSGKLNRAGKANGSDLPIRTERASRTERQAEPSGQSKWFGFANP
ncbi:hypothetical protein QUF72_01675, partial [Desulfobacterales bacterium HSG2]|nr:hypothetical protein [Desulfobacterales bacterium HSG2]